MGLRPHADRFLPLLELQHRPDTNSYGVGADWAPIKEAKVRGSYQQAVRAANIIELFTAQGFNLFDMSGGDPCGPSKQATLAQCLRTGLAAGQYGSKILDNTAGQYNYLQGGNPDLQPETAKTYTFGGVFQPMASMSATVDYWHIQVDDAVGIVRRHLALHQCLDVGAVLRPDPPRRQRQPLASEPGYVSGAQPEHRGLQDRRHRRDVQLWDADPGLREHRSRPRRNLGQRVRYHAASGG